MDNDGTMPEEERRTQDGLNGTWKEGENHWTRAKNKFEMVNKQKEIKIQYASSLGQLYRVIGF